MKEIMAGILASIESNFTLISHRNEDFDASFETKAQKKIVTLRRRGEPVNILVIGPTGSGKSTLINALMGKSGAKVGKGAASVTSEVKLHEGEYEGVQIRVYDTVGFSDSKGKSDKNIVREIAKANKFDLILICLRMDSRSDDKVKKMFTVLSSLLNKEMWDRTVVVLTFANSFLQLDNITDLTESQQKQELTGEIEAFKGHVCNYLRQSKIKEETLSSIPFCIAGRVKSRRIPPITEDWLVDLWKKCLLRCSNDEVRAFLTFFANYRLLVEASVATSTTAVGGVMGGAIGGAVGSVVFPIAGTVAGAAVGAGIGAGIGAGVGIIGVAIKRHNEN